MSIVDRTNEIPDLIVVKTLDANTTFHAFANGRDVFFKYFEGFEGSFENDIFVSDDAGGELAENLTSGDTTAGDGGRILFFCGDVKGAKYANFANNGGINVG